MPRPEAFTVKKETFRRLAADESNLPRKDQGKHSIPNSSFDEFGPDRKPGRSRPRVTRTRARRMMAQPSEREV